MGVKRRSRLPSGPDASPPEQGPSSAEGAPAGDRAKILVAGVGHRFWSDYSTGPEWSDRLAERDWPDGVTVADYSYGAWAMTQQLQDERFDRCIFISAEPRGREAAGVHLYRYRHDRARFDPLRVHDHMFEAVAGVISVDLLLVVAGHFEALPPQTWVIEIEPANTDWGDGGGISATVQARYPEVEQLVLRLVAGEQPEGAEAQIEPPLGAYGVFARRTAGAES